MLEGPTYLIFWILWCAASEQSWTGTFCHITKILMLQWIHFVLRYLTSWMIVFQKLYPPLGISLFGLKIVLIILKEFYSKNALLE